MAHEITSQDGLVMVGAPAWHGLGIVLPEGDLEPREARRLAGLDWIVREEPLFCKRSPTDLVQGITTHKAIVREDTGDVLGVVGADFHPVQNGELFELLQALGRPVETAGSIRGGRVVFGLLRQGSFRLGPPEAGDVVHKYLLASNGHDGSAALRFTPTDVRVVCRNTLARAEETGVGVRYLHTAGLARRLDEAKRSLERAEALVSVQQEEAELLYRTTWDDETFSAFLRSTLADLRPGVALSTVRASLETVAELELWASDGMIGPDADPAHRRLAELASDLVLAVHHPENTLPGMTGTAWQAYQGVSRWAQHERKGRMDALTSELAGPVRGIKGRAWSRALQLSREARLSGLLGPGSPAGGSGPFHWRDQHADRD